MFKTELTEKLGIEYPIIQAGMGGVAKCKDGQLPVASIKVASGDNVPVRADDRTPPAAFAITNGALTGFELIRQRGNAKLIACAVLGRRQHHDHHRNIIGEFEFRLFEGSEIGQSSADRFIFDRHAGVDQRQQCQGACRRDQQRQTHNRRPAVAQPAVAGGRGRPAGRGSTGRGARAR